MAGFLFKLNFQNIWLRGANTHILSVFEYPISEVIGTFYYIEQKRIFSLILRIQDSEPGFPKVIGSHWISVAEPSAVSQEKSINSTILGNFPPKGNSRHGSSSMLGIYRVQC